MDHQTQIKPPECDAGPPTASQAVSPLEAFLENSEDAVFSKTLDNVIVMWSRGAERVYGYSREEMIGASVQCLCPPERTGEIQEISTRVARGEHIGRFETVRQAKDGRLLNVSLNVSPVRDDTGRITGAITAARDITERKHMEQALQDTEAEYRRLLDTAYEGVWVTDAQGRTTYANVRMAQLLGCTPEELPGRLATEFLFEEDRQEAEARMQRRREGFSGQAEVRLRTKDGAAVWVLSSASGIYKNGEYVGTLAMLTDITERKRMEEAVRRMESEARHHTLLLEAANRVALDILSSQTGIEALQHIAEAARRLAGARYAALGVARLDGQELAEFLTTGLTPAEEAAIGPRPRGAGVLGQLLQRGQPLRLDRIADHPASVGFPPHHPPMESFLGVPIRRAQTVLGSLYLTNKHGGGPFTDADEAAVQAIAGHAAIAIQHWQMLSRQRSLVRGLITAQEEERRAVAYDLHDGLTQYVMASHAHLEAFGRAHESGNAERAARELAQGMAYLKESVVESRRLVNGLRSLALEDMGLAGALEQLLNEEKVRAGWQEAEFVHNVAGQRFDVALETSAYRIAQEALTNARKHARTERVRLLLLAGNDEQSGLPRLTLEIRDWGQGFVSEEKDQALGGVGLSSMSERAHIMGGHFELDSAPGRGTIVRAVFPALPPSAPLAEEEQP